MYKIYDYSKTPTRITEKQSTECEWGQSTFGPNCANTKVIGFRFCPLHLRKLSEAAIK